MSQTEFRSDSSSGITESPGVPESPGVQGTPGVQGAPAPEMPAKAPPPATAPPTTAPPTTPANPAADPAGDDALPIAEPLPAQQPAQRPKKPNLKPAAQSSQKQPAQPKPTADQRGGKSSPASHGKSYDSVPPPGPARSTLPPVRPGPEIAARNSGVGSAKGVRWRGELESIEKRAEREKAAKRATAIAHAHGQPTPPEAEEFEEEHELTEELVKSAPPWLISTIIHLILLLVLALLSSPAGQGVTNLVLNFSQGEPEAPVELAEFAIDADVSDADQDTMEDSDFDAEVPEIFEVIEPEMSEIKPLEFGVGKIDVDFSKPMFNGRTGAMRKALLSIYGGTKQTEEAVALGLKWLKKVQMKDGGWSMRRGFSDGSIHENRCAATAMALLAFLGAGSTHQSGEYADEVDRGLKFLIHKQMAGDRSGFMAKGARPHEKMYAQAQATIALCEMYAMTDDSWLRPYAQKAIDFAENAQSASGGWRYAPKDGEDLSMTGWYVMALQSGKSAGLDVNESILRKVSGFLDTVSHDEGASYSYVEHERATAAMTAEGLLCRQYLGWGHEEVAMQTGILALLDQAPFDLKDPEGRDVYYWYYFTQVLHHYGGAPWRKWNEKMREGLPKIQIKTGAEKGSWPPQLDNWGRNYGRLYTTCLSIYCLEVYYRHMPLYKPEQK